MKNKIKLNYSDKLHSLLTYPNEFALLVKIAFHMDEDTGVALSSDLKYEQHEIDNLILWGLVTMKGDGYSVKDKSIVDITLQRKPEKNALRETMICELDEKDVPEEDLEYFKLTKHFQELFRFNLEALRVRTNNVDSAKYGSWVDAVRLMLTTDNITVDELRDVYSFIKGHYFWSASVQSTPKLREKFQTIISQLKADGFKRNNGKGKKEARTTTSRRKDYK